MASNLVKTVNRHISIVKDGNLDKFIVLQRCLNTECAHTGCGGNGFHCPLCPKTLICNDKPSKIRNHISTVHIAKRVTAHDGKYILK